MELNSTTSESLEALLNSKSRQNTEEIGDRASLVTIAWLRQGLKLSRAVVRIADRMTGRALGTGFLIAPNLLMTNHHVLPDPETADQAIIQFNYELDWNRRKENESRYRFRPSGKGFFRTNEELDYTIVQTRRNPGRLFGFIDLWDENATAVISERDSYVNIIQHPGGSFKQIALTDNKVIDSFNNVIQYTTATQAGASGSPVFNQAWKLVALHHRGSKQLEGSDSTRRPAQEGIQISKIIEHLGASFLDEVDSTIFSGGDDSTEIAGEEKLEYDLYDFLIDIKLQRSLMQLLDKAMPEDAAQQFAEVLLDDYPDVLKLFDKIQAAPTTKMVTVITPAIAAGVVCARRYPKETEIRKSAFVDALALDHLIAFIKQKLDTPDFIDEPIILRDLKDQSDKIIQPITQEIESQQNQPIEPLSVNVKNPNNFQIDLESLKMVALLGFRIGFTAYRRAFPQPLP